MAEKEIVAQIDKLRKTRPARAIDVLWNSAGDPFTGNADALVAVLGMLRDDLKDEARLVEQAKLRGGTSIVKDRLAVAGWIELFVVQLGRESNAPSVPAAATERLSPSPELTEHRPSERGTVAAVLPGPGGRCAVGNIHTTSTVKCPCGYTVTHANTGEIEAFLSGAIDTLPTLHTNSPCDVEPVIANDSALSGAAGELKEMAANGRAVIERAASRLGVDLAEQTAHDTIDRELAHVTADPVVDPFAPIPRAVWGGPAIPPGGKTWTTGDLLTPVDASLLPAHLSFSQATTVVECGAKYRMQRIAVLPQVPQWANIGGTAFHTCVQTIEESGNEQALTDRPALDNLWSHEFEEQISATENLSGMARESFRASAQGRESYDWWRVEGAAMLQRYVDWRQGAGASDALLKGPSGAPMLEWETTYDVDSVPFKTILDSVWAGPESMINRTAIIRDWKTGSMASDDRQLCTQAWGLRKAGWTGPVLVQFFDARKGVFSEPFDPFERMSWDDVRYFVLSADAQRRLPILPARPSDFCGGCSVAYACPIMGQRKAPKVVTK